MTNSIISAKYYTFYKHNLLGENLMKTNAPRFVTWVIAVILGVLGIIAMFVVIPTISAYAAWLLIAGFVILAIANVVKGL